MARFASQLLGVTLAMALLSACATAGPPVSDAASYETPTPVPTAVFTPTPPAVPTASPVPADGGEAVRPLAEYVSADTLALTIVPIDGDPVSFDYFTADVDEVTAALTLAFGVEPYVDGSPTPGQTQTFDWYGFSLITAHLPGDYPELPRFYLWVTAPGVNGVPALIGGSPGIGGHLAGLGDAFDEPLWSNATGGLVEAFPVEVPLEQIPDPNSGVLTGPVYNATLVWFSNPDQIITHWTAPERRY